MGGAELNYRQQLLEEICFEGLDGITLQVTKAQSVISVR